MFTTKFALFGLVLSLTRASSEWQLMKCCPPGQIFVFDEFKCVPVPLIFAIEVYSHYWNLTSEFQGIPQCNEPEDLVTTSLDDLKSNTILEVPACLELFYKIGENKHIMIIHYCRPNKDQQVKTNDTSFPQLLHTRKCCFGDTIFDSSTKTCVTQLNETQSLGAVLINKSTAESAVILSFSSLTCRGPIVTYEINENDIFLRNNTYSVKNPELNNIVKQEPVIADNICIEMMSEFAVKQSLAVRICRKPEFCDKNACIRKCCSEDEHLYLDERQNITLIGCNTRPVPNIPGKFYNALANAVSQSKSFTFDTTKVHGIWSNVLYPVLHPYIPCEKIHRSGDPDEWEERMSSKSNGHTNGWHCFDVMEDKVNNFYRFELLYCDEYTIKQNYNYNNTINDVVQSPAWITPLLVVKCILLLMTLLVYAYLPKLQNIYGKMVICYVSNILLTAILQLISNWFNKASSEQQRRTECKFLSYIGFFSGLAISFWLNVMCFDMWRFITTFENRKNCNNRKRFLLYCLYGWGIPLLLSILIIVADNTDFLPEYLIPNIGHIFCGLIYAGSWDNYSDLIFHFGPQTILLISNVVFFILTTKYYNKVKADIQNVNTDSRSKQLHSSRKRFIMIVKLFIVMGMQWIVVTVSYFHKSFGSYPLLEMIYFIALSISDGFLIFIILVLKKSVYQAIRKRLQDIRKNQPAT